MKTKQRVAVVAQDLEGASARVGHLLLMLDDKYKWFKRVHLIEEETETLTNALVDDLETLRFHHAQNVFAGLDMNRLTAGINAYGDETVNANERLKSDIMERFRPQVDKIIEVVTFLDNRWCKDSVIFDLEEMTADISFIKDRISNDPDKQFVGTIELEY